MMVSARFFAAALLLGAVVCVPAEAHAGPTVPLSTIAALPSPAAIKSDPGAPVPGLTLKEKDGYGDHRWIEITASVGRGYCIATNENGSRWMSTTGASVRAQSEDVDLARLVEKDGTATFERTRVHFDPAHGTVTPLGRSRVDLHELVRTAAGVVVWAYRDGRDVVVLSRSVTRGVESSRGQIEETGVPFVSADGCPFAGARLDGRRAEAGTFAQLAGDLPKRGNGKDVVIPRFIVDVSLSRVAREPEPLVAVRVRVRD